jgi:hypothetical protein
MATDEVKRPASVSSTTARTLTPISKAGHYGNLDEHQEQNLAELEKKLTEEGVLPDPLLDSEEQRVTVLL